MDLGLLVSLFGRLQLGFVVLGVAFLGLAYAIKWIRWHQILRQMNQPVTPSQTRAAFFIGVLVNNISPVKLGEVARLASLHVASKASKTTVLTSILIERIFDGTALVTLFFMSVQFIEAPLWVTVLLRLGMTLFFGLLVGCYLLTWFPLPKNKAWLALKTKPKMARLTAAVESLWEGMQVIHSPGRTLFVAGLSFGVWVSEWVLYWSFAQAFDFPIGIAQAGVLLGVINFGTLIFTAPGSLGTFEFLMVQAFVLFGLTRTQGLAYAFFAHFWLYVPLSLVGIWYMVHAGFSLKSVLKESKGSANDDSL